MKKQHLMPLIYSAILATGILFGIYIAKSNGITATPKSSDNFYINDIFSLIDKEYVDTININELQNKAITHILESMDPHSEYIKPDVLDDVNDNLHGSFHGIGVSFRIEKDTIAIINTIKGGPSEKVGILAGDRIIYVGDTLVAGTKVTNKDAMRLLKGPKKTKVDVKIKRRGVEELLDFTIVRDVIPTHSIDVAYMIDDNIGFIKMTKFSATTHKEFVEAVKKLKAEGMTQLILDLRDNTGGYFDQSWKLANEFLGRGQLVVYMQGRNRPRDEFDADGRGKLQDIELSVLINEGSASSSEIFAGAIQDNDRGVIIGRRSFGKGLVQEPVNFTDGSGIRLTVARFYTPSGRCIQKPYDKNYDYDIYERYAHGEMTSADSMKIDTTSVYYTLKGRHVYGGGGIIPDIFVPIDTTKATDFYVKCNRKATSVRFAQTMFDKYRGALASINDFAVLDTYLDGIDLASQFLDYAARIDGIKPEKGEWEKSAEYMMPQLKALVGRFSKLGDEAFHRYYIPIDDTIQSALKNSSVID